MPGITAILIVILLISAVFGVFTKNRGVRLAAWFVVGVCLMGFMLYFSATPHILQR